MGLNKGLPDIFDSNIKEEIFIEEKDIIVNTDFSIKWTYESCNRIYVQNFASHAMGISDPNMSLSAYRSSIIMNSLLGLTVKNSRNDDQPLIRWRV